MIENPFSSTSTLPEDNDFVEKTFVEDTYVVTSFVTKRHSFIWGTRGSGKSTLLKYFEVICQKNKYNSWQEFIGAKNSFIGIYCPLSRGMLDDSKFAKLDEYSILVLPKHLLNVLISIQLIDTLIMIDEIKNKKLANELRMKQTFLDLLGASDEIRKKIDFEKTFLEFVGNFFKAELLRINKYIQYSPKIEMKFNCCLTDYHDYIVPLVKLIKDEYDIHIPFYFMFDDMGYAPKNIQRYLNTWIANRDNNYIVVKIASNPLYYNDFKAEDGYDIDKTHDYTEIQLDYTNRTDKNTFRKNIVEIARKRLYLTTIEQKDPEALFPVDNDHEKLFEEAKKRAFKLAQEKEIVDINRFINRTAISELHKILASRKRNRSYAGLENLILLSSGNFRNFLRLADAILTYITEEDNIDLLQLNQVSPEKQQAAIIQFSKNEFEKISEFRTDVEKSVIEKTSTLIEALCSVYKYRLKEGSFQESAITAFSIKNYNELEEEYKEIIRYARIKGHLISKSVKTKTGNGRETIYELNKLFVPAFNLEPNDFAGKISFSNDEIAVAMKDKIEFLNNYKGKHSKQQDDEDNYYQLVLDDIF